MTLISELQAATDLFYDTKNPVDLYFKSNVLLHTLLSRGKKYNGGRKIQVNLEYDMSNAGSYGPRSLLPIAKREILTAAFFEYAAYFATLTVDMDDELMNSGPQQIVNLVNAKLKNAAKSIRLVMGTQIYQSRATGLAADPESKPFLGLADLFNTTTSTAYGEITEAELALWKAKTDATAQTMGFKFMQSLRRLAATDVTDEGKPDLYITTELLKDGFERTLQVSARYTSQKLAQAGFDNVLFKGSPLVADDKCAANYIYALNTRMLDIYTHSKRDFTKPEWTSPPQQPDTATANIRWAGQLVCRHRGAHAMASNVSEPA